MKNQKLPSTEGLPYGIVRLTQWSVEDEEGVRTGTRRRNTPSGWRNERNLQDTITELNPGETWVWDGFHLNGFNMRWFKNSLSDRAQHPKLLEGMQLIQEWFRETEPGEES